MSIMIHLLDEGESKDQYYTKHSFAYWNMNGSLSKLSWDWLPTSCAVETIPYLRSSLPSRFLLSCRDWLTQVLFELYLGMTEFPIFKSKSVIA